MSAPPIDMKVPPDWLRHPITRMVGRRFKDEVFEALEELERACESTSDPLVMRALTKWQMVKRMEEFLNVTSDD